MFLKRLFGKNNPSIISPSLTSRVIYLTDRRDQQVEKQLAKCMKEIQQMMAEKRNTLNLKVSPKIRVVLHTVN